MQWWYSFILVAPVPVFAVLVARCRHERHTVHAVLRQQREDADLRIDNRMAYSQFLAPVDHAVEMPEALYKVD
jgi:hypothetical protein